MKNEKIWYLFIEDREEGPFSFTDLRRDTRITYKTLARRSNWKEWKEIRYIPELTDLFEDPVALDDLKSTPQIQLGDDAEIALEFKSQNPLFLLLLLLLSLLLFLLFLELNK